MRILLYVSILLLWSSYLPADEMSLNVLNFEPRHPFKPLTNEYPVEDKSQSVFVKNMPRVRSQDSFNTCYGCSSATIAQKYICDNHPSYVGKNCSALTPDMEISQLDLISKSLTNRDGQSKGMPSNHTNIRIKDEDRKKTSGVHSLLNAQPKFSFNSELCFPFDQLVEKYGDKSIDLTDKLLKRLEDYYISKRTEADSTCTECLQDIDHGLNAAVTQDQFNTALKKNSFGEFLYSLIFNKQCEKKINLPEGPNVGLFPKINEPSQKSDLLAKLKEAIGTTSSNRPVLLGNVCLYLDKKSNQCFTHSVVISGYKTMCNDKKTKCKSFVKVHNCWGNDWQAANADGWVDAENLMNNVNPNLDRLNDGVLSWYF